VNRGPLEFKSLRRLLDEPELPTRYRIAGWQPLGTRVLLAAQFKAGKTTLVTNLIRSLVDGDPFLGSFDVDPIVGTVAHFDLEMSQSMLSKWLRAQGIKNDDRVFPVSLRGRLSDFPLLDRKRRQELARQLETNGAQYVVWDCVRPLVDSYGLDENKDAGKLLTAFDALLEEAGVKDAAVVQHMGHTGERARGDSRFRDWPDVEWRLVRQDENPHSPRFISAYGRDVDQPEAQVEYDKETRRLSIVGGSRHDAKVGELAAEVLEALGADELSGRDIENKIPEGVSRKDWRAAMKLAIADGRIETRSGPRRSTLHKVSAPVRQSAPPVRQPSSAPVRQCVYTHAHGTLEFDPSKAFGVAR
jgi:hypothetical protein